MSTMIGVLRVVRIDLAVRLADDLLVLADARPRVAAERRRFPGGDLDFRDPGLGGGRGEQPSRHRQNARHGDGRHHPSRPRCARMRCGHALPPRGGRRPSAALLCCGSKRADSGNGETAPDLCRRIIPPIAARGDARRIRRHTPGSGFRHEAIKEPLIGVGGDDKGAAAEAARLAGTPVTPWVPAADPTRRLSSSVGPLQPCTDRAPATTRARARRWSACGPSRRCAKNCTPRRA